MPVTGDLHVGGTYILRNKTEGRILRCEPPRLLKVTLTREGSSPEEVEVRLSSDATGNTVLEIKHTGAVEPATWAQLRTGTAETDCALVVKEGVNWDLNLAALNRNLSGVNRFESWLMVPGREFVAQSCNAWKAAFEAAGATDHQSTMAVQRVKEQFYDRKSSRSKGKGAGG